MCTLTHQAGASHHAGTLDCKLVRSKFWHAWCVQDYINKLTHLLLASEEGGDGAALAQIHELVEAQRWAVQW